MQSVWWSRQQPYHSATCCLYCAHVCWCNSHPTRCTKKPSAVTTNFVRFLVGVSLPENTDAPVHRGCSLWAYSKKFVWPKEVHFATEFLSAFKRYIEWEIRLNENIVYKNQSLKTSLNHSLISDSILFAKWNSQQPESQRCRTSQPSVLYIFALCPKKFPRSPS